LAEIDPRLAQGIAANERAYGKKLDHDRYDNDDETDRTTKTPSAKHRATD
jgi:hypothetical protein